MRRAAEKNGNKMDTRHSSTTQKIFIYIYDDAKQQRLENKYMN